MPTSSRQYQSVYNHQTVQHFAELAEGMEENVDGRDGSGQITPPEGIYYGTVLSAVLGSHRFAEAAINELIDDIITQEEMKSRPQLELDDGIIEDLRVLDRSYGRSLTYQNLLPKTQIVLLLADSSPFDKSRDPFQSVLTLHRVRNYFEHYEPDTIPHTEDEIPKPGEELQNCLRGFSDGEPQKNPFSLEDDPYFPRKCMSSTTAYWASSTAMNFVKEFHERLGLSWPSHVP